MSVLTIPAIEGPRVDPFNTIHDDLLATLRLHKKHSDSTTQPIAAALIEELTAQKESLRAKSAQLPASSRPAKE